MTTAGVPTPPRWDGHRLIFELNIDDAVVVRCAISRLALIDVSGGGPFRTTDLMSRFAGARPRIEAAAYAKLRERSSPPLGILHIWEDDILDPSPDSTPRAMAASMRHG